MMIPTYPAGKVSGCGTPVRYENFIAAVSSGGDINGRLRLTLEVIREIRKRCGDDFVMDVRISGDEYSDGGLTLNDMIYAIDLENHKNKTIKPV